MDKAKWSLIALVALGVLVVAMAAGMAVIEWEWWPFLLVLSGMAFVVGLGLFLVRRVLA